MDICLSNDNASEEATASLEHGSNHLSVKGIHRRSHRSSDASSGRSLGTAIGRDEDELHSTYGANTDEEDLESDPQVPRVGMEFDSEVAVYNFYSSYAKQTGFNVRRGKAEYSGSAKGVVRAKSFLCSCGGHKSKEQIANAMWYKRRDARTGCDAKIECAVNDGTWKISEVVLEHNHVTTALSTGRIAYQVRAVGERALDSDADPTWEDRPRPAPEETQDLIDHFRRLARLDCCSCYSLRVAEARGMENFFWRDSRSKVDYEHFSDLLVLDTRTWISKYGMIFAMFWGLNHHRKPTIFGHGLLVDRTVGSFHWLLDTFLQSMNWRKPQTIITEVGEEIAEAVSLVLPETRHCLPAWSVLNSFRKYLSPLSDQLDVVELFRKCVFLRSREEFESKWNSFIGKYKLRDNSWLASLYKMHEKWSHAFTKNVFSVGLLSIQNVEDAGSLSKINVFSVGLLSIQNVEDAGSLSSETMTLTEIAWRSEQVAKEVRAEEFRDDMLCEKNTVNLKTRNPTEKEAGRLYTPRMFEMFQKEFINCLGLAMEEIKCSETLRMFQLTEAGDTKTHTASSRQIVEYDSSDSTLACSCGKFESVGILCDHVFRVLNFTNVVCEIPPRYFLKRWTKSAKDSVPVPVPTPSAAARDKGPVDSFTGEFVRKALHVAHMSVNKKRERIATSFIDSAVEHIAKVLKTEEVAAALDHPDVTDDKDRTICEYALETQLDQENAAKPGMGCPRVKRKVEFSSRPAGKRVSLFLTALPH
ncbi:protein FAR1-RELATED SEQUENCE 7-like [Eucalyptus grandis]|uniref:protein FAR1-RELATED SEQUENCE 7-like n=1 Tax=Eucalyptus grandis TaxID=71139 RepID=UPI00192F0D53|nr:protein FAR1-RELATED SEQUENCE 7-like [Eucalyptus grandis]